jgi:hypothetical protein
MTSYFYNPVLKKTKDGVYYVDIYKYKNGKMVFDSYKASKDYNEVLFYVRFYVKYMNEYAKKNIFQKLFKN